MSDFHQPVSSIKALLTLAVAVASWNTAAGEWKQFPSLPDAQGFAGSFAGVSNGALLVAGGTNFPDKKPWEGGAKVWYDEIHALESSSAKWKMAGKLPRPLGYGVSVTNGNGLLCAGGSDRDRHYADVFRLEWSNGKLMVTPLPSLPSPIANSCGAMVGEVLYVAGGIEKPDSARTSNRVWKLDLGAKLLRWVDVASWPGSGRMLAVACGCDNAFWLIGGVDLANSGDGTVRRRYLMDAYRYEPHDGWARIADLPYSVVAAPSPAPFDDRGLYLLGGDDGLQAATSPDKHRGFRKMSLRYDLASNKWTQAGIIAAPRATLPTAFWNGSWVLIGGEVRPGVRSPEVWNWTPETME